MQITLWRLCPKALLRTDSPRNSGADTNERRLFYDIETQEGKPSRHVYSMTDLGLEVLQEMLREFTPEMATSDVEFQVRVALFGLVDQKTRSDVLATRRAVLEKGLKHLQEGIEREMLDESMIYGKRVVELLKARVIQELEWIAAIEEESEPC